MIYSYIPDPIRREPMGKTVTVEVELPEGLELGDCEGKTLLFGYPSPSGREVSISGFLPVRPIPAEKTWERPEWLHKSWKWLLYDAGWRVSSYEQRPDILRDNRGQSVPLSLAIIAYNGWPDPSGLPPAERIWRIVEGGQG